ncbi:hypothetical protein B0H16DRAFT_635735 [Mycena metata]|uniref:Uncharacterized protein n=1 Tax=Mycena metata TaxID=1033252 RepID=A0AAD7H4F9_9AGAR|nr:hypothetical protein B0H16DRAFT_635735 [Mycena metata]
MAQGTHLPDEIISEILSPALRVPDEAFSASTFGTWGLTLPSPFANFSEPCCVYLVVCKAWLRVATPLLYNVVVLRSKAQAQALAATLTANPQLGRFIHKLRVEGGYAISMHKILQNSTNMTDLFLSVAIPGSDNASGLCRGLPLVDPVRVIIDSGIGSSLSRGAQKLIQALEECIPKWKRMAVFEVQHELIQRETTYQALKQAPGLVTLSVSDPRHILWGSIPQYMRTIATNPALKSIRIVYPPSQAGYEQYFLLRMLFRNAVNEDEKMRLLFHFDDVKGSSAEDDLPPVPFIYPAQLAADPQREDAIWSRILYFTLYIAPSKEKPFSPRNDRRSHATTLLVCKKFHRLGLPYLYENPVLNSSLAHYSLSNQMSSQPSLGRHIRTLHMRRIQTPSCFRTIISLTPRLVELHVKDCSPITWKTFVDLGGTAGSTLQSFCGIKIAKASAVDPTVFARYPEMRDFGWDSTTVFKTTPKLIPVDAFGLLANLTVNIFDESFVKVLAQMELPSLRTVTFSATANGGVQFFERHGAKLREVTLSSTQIVDTKLAIWRNCPNLTVLGISCDSKHPARPSCLEIGDTHERIERIVFKLTHEYRLRPSHETDLTGLLRRLRASKSFPALREVMHPNCVWPTTEREILKSHWVQSAGVLLERGVHLVGPQGVHWRPRLKFVSKTKKY